MRLFVSVLLITALMAGNGCKKGEQGPAGERGPAGPQGSTGTQGPQGPSGNANVKSYGPFYVPSFGWTTTDNTSWQAKLPVSAITQEVVNGGLVHVYMQDSTRWWTLPYLEADEYYVFGIEVGQVNISFGHSHATQIPKPAPAYFRVVVIPASAIQGNRQKNVPVAL